MFVVPNTEVVRFDIAMDEFSVMNVFNAGDHLVDENQQVFMKNFRSVWLNKDSIEEKAQAKKSFHQNRFLILGRI